MWILGPETIGSAPAPPRQRFRNNRVPRPTPTNLLPHPNHLTLLEAVLPTDPSVPLPRFEPIAMEGVPPVPLLGPGSGGLSRKRSRGAAAGGAMPPPPPALESLVAGAWDSDASAEADVMIFADAISRMQVGVSWGVSRWMGMGCVM